MIACTPPTPLPKSHIYYPTHTRHQTSLEQFRRAICGAVFWAAVLTLPQTLNLQLSHCALFLFSVDTTITSNLTLGGFKQQTFITRGSGDYEVQDQSDGRSDLMSGEDPNPGLQTQMGSQQRMQLSRCFQGLDRPSHLSAITVSHPMRRLLG